MKKLFAAGLLSCSLVAPSLFSQAPPPRVPEAREQQATAFRPTGEQWSVQLPKGWKATSSETDTSRDPNSLFARCTSHLVTCDDAPRMEVTCLYLKRAEPLTAKEKEGLRDSLCGIAEQKVGTVVRTSRDAKSLGLPAGSLVEDWTTHAGSNSPRHAARAVVTDHVAYVMIPAGIGSDDGTLAVIDSFRLTAKEAPRPMSPGVTAKPPAVTDAAIRPARNAPGPAAVTAPPKLPALFESLGHSAKNVGTEAEPIYELRFHRDGWNYVLKCQYSKDRQVLWLFSNLGGEGVDPSRLSPSAVLALLGENDKDRLAYFSFNADRKQFCLNTAIEPKQLSATLLRERIDLLTAVIKETAPAWGALATDRK